MSIAEQLIIGHLYTLNIDDNLIIKKGTKVLIQYVHDFPTTNKVFVTLLDTENFNTDRNGKPEQIITTIECNSETLLILE